MVWPAVLPSETRAGPTSDRTMLSSSVNGGSVSGVAISGPFQTQSRGERSGAFLVAGGSIDAVVQKGLGLLKEIVIQFALVRPGIAQIGLEKFEPFARSGCFGQRVPCFLLGRLADGVEDQEHRRAAFDAQIGRFLHCVAQRSPPVGPLFRRD